MALYKRSREDNFCDSIYANEHENPPKRSCPLPHAGVLLLSDLLFADDDDYDIYAQEDSEKAQKALVLDMMASLDQEINSCNNSISSSDSDAAGVYSYYHSFWDNCCLPSIAEEIALANSSNIKMDDQPCTVSIDYLLRATDEELGIPPTPPSDLNKSTDHEVIFNSDDIESIWDGLTIEMELQSRFEKVEGIAGRVVPAQGQHNSSFEDNQLTIDDMLSSQYKAVPRDS